MANYYGGPPGGVPGAPGPQQGYPQHAQQADYGQAYGQQPGGYAQAPGAQGGYGPAPGALAVSGSTVMGVPLQPGERVVYFYQPSYTGDKIALWILFVFTFWILIGFIFLYQVLTWDKKHPKAQIVTTMRIIQVPGEGEALSYWLQQISDLEPVRQKAASGGGGGLLGAAIRAGVNAVANHMADKKQKTERGYWARAIAVTLIDHGGMRHQIDSKDAINLGMFIAAGMFQGGFQNCPDVYFAP